MVTATITAVFGLLGALIGAGATLLGQRTIAAAQQREARATRAQQLHDVQREASARFLSCADLLIAEADELRRVLQNSELEHLVESVYPRYYDRWCEFMASRADLQSVASDELRIPAVHLREPVHDLIHAVDNWYRTRRAPRGAAGYQPHYDRAVNARDEFAGVVQQNFGATV